VQGPCGDSSQGGFRRVGGLKFYEKPKEKTTMNSEIEIKLLQGHPKNRVMGLGMPGWEDFLDSIREHGIFERLIVRPLGKNYQVLSGHRRLAAAKELKMKQVPCVIMEMADKEAMVFLINSNLHRKNMSIMDEANMVTELRYLGMTDEDIQQELSVEPMWLKVRQAVFEFDDEVQRALDLEELSEDAFRWVLWAPEPVREKAMDVVMGRGESCDEPMSGERAREYVQFTLMPEFERQQEWEAAMDKTQKAVKKEVSKLCTGAENPPTVLVMPWGQQANGLGGDMVQAKELVPIEFVNPEEEVGKTWAYCAACVGAPIYVLPPLTRNGDRQVLVSKRVLMDDAAARSSHGGELGYLVPKGVVKSCQRVEKALAVLEGEGEKDFDPAEPVGTVATPEGKDGIKIDQSMEHSAMIDMGVVKKVAMWAISEDRGTPKWLPAWALSLESEGKLHLVDEICNWVMSLKNGGGK